MQEIKNGLKNVIKKVYRIDFDADLSPAPENINADYSSNAPLKLAKGLRQAPYEIAEEIKNELEKLMNKTNQSAIQITVSQPGFINFALADRFLTDSLTELSQGSIKDAGFDSYKKKTVICEFSDPNPFKVLHVGHLYTSIVGDSIGKLFEYAGAKVIRANYGGDVGLHVAKTMYALQQKNPKNLKIDDIAKCYIEGTAAYEEDESAKLEITRLNKEIYKINSEKLHDSMLANLYWQGRELSYDYFSEFYDSIGVKFDKYYPESTVANLGLKTVKEQLKNGIYEMSGAAVIFNGEKYGLHTRVFINGEGVPTYEAKEVGLAMTKWQDYHFDESIIITGSEQSEYMKVVYKSIEQFAPELTKRAKHLVHGLVKLPGNVKMSSRKGNFLKAVDVIKMVKEELKREYNSSDDKIVLAAIKYAFLKYKMGGNIIFSPKESVKMTGASGPYLLYSAVRAKKILEKASLAANQGKNNAKTEVETLQPSEKALIMKILEYQDTLQSAVSEMAPHKVANFLYDLAQNFSRFYENCTVVGSSREKGRTQIVEVYLKIMTHGLGLLGIEIPEAM